jgi:hypothetical protein
MEIEFIMVKSTLWIRKKLLLLPLAAAVLIAPLLFIPLPKSVISFAVKYSAAWILNGVSAPPTGVDGAMQKLVGEVIQQSLVAHFRSAGPHSPKGRDAAFAAEQLRRLRPMLINQSELYHNPIKGQMALSGLAWCDEANGLAGRLLAYDFDNVQIVGVRDPKSGLAHSFGRFWSSQYNNWLYFDVWPEEVFVFRPTMGGDVEYLHSSRPLGDHIEWPDDVLAAKMAHKMVRRGFVHNELQSNVGSYFLHRITNLLMHDHTAPTDAIPFLSAIAEQTTFSSGRPAPKAHSRAIGIYANARVEHFFGNYDRAAALYRDAARRDKEESVFGLAATIFAGRLEASKRPITKPRRLE